MRDSTGKWSEMKAGLEPKVLSPQGHSGFRKDEFQPRLILSPFPKRNPGGKGPFIHIILNTRFHAGHSAEIWR